MEGPKVHPTISDQRRWLEVFVVAIIGLVKPLFMDTMDRKLPFIIFVIVGWTIYIFIRARTVRGILYYWGFRRDNFKKVFLMLLPLGLISLAAFVTAGFFLGTIDLNWHLIPILLLYPIWGVFQQFLLIGLVAGNLMDIRSSGFNKPIVILISAIMFGLVHYPYWWLVVGTFLLAIVYGFVYQREKNLYVLGIFHGWLAAFYYYTVVGRDPFVQVFGNYI